MLHHLFRNIFHHTHRHVAHHTARHVAHHGARQVAQQFSQQHPHLTKLAGDLAQEAVKTGIEKGLKAASEHFDK